MNEKKSKYWAFLLYEDSMPTNYKEIITQWFLPVCISPKHDKDVYEETTESHKKGEIKKTHYHVLLCFGNTTTYKTALNYAKELGANIVKPISSSKGAYDYWTHKNNPEKAQYNEEDMQYFGGFNTRDYIGKTEHEIDIALNTIIHIINDKNLYELKEVYDYLDKMNLTEYRDLIHHKTLFIKEYVKSKKFMVDEQVKKMLKS